MAFIMVEKDASKNNSFAVADFDSDEEGLPVRIDSGRIRRFRRKQSKPNSDSNEVVSSDEEYANIVKRQKHRKQSMKSWTDLSLAAKNVDLTNGKSDEEPTEPALPGYEDLLSVMLPTGITMNKDDIPDPLVPDFVYNGEFLISITKVKSPYKFWFFFNAQTPAFRDLVLKMEEFYSTCDLEAFKIAPGHLKQNTVAALKVGRSFKRIIILHYDAIKYNLGDGLQKPAKIFDLDYGEVYYVDVKDLLYLKKSFAEIPRFSYRGRLALVSPIKANHWSPHAKQEFVGLTQSHGYLPLIAKLYAFEDDEQIFHLVMTNKDDNRANGSIRHIFADLGCCRLSEPDNERWPSKDELYPSFDLLENDEDHDNIYNQESAEYLSEQNKNHKLNHCFVITKQIN